MQAAVLHSRRRRVRPGLLFKKHYGIDVPAGPPRREGEAAAGIFLAAYPGLVVPIMGVGARFVSLTSGLTAFRLVILAVLAGVGLQLRTLRA